jgi:hypothetical protein
VLQDVFPTTFSAIRKWLAGRAILHGLPESVRVNPLRELVHVYVQAARWGHRSIVHDSVNNMPLLGSPFEFLETCAIVYREACAGVAFRNFFKKGLPVVLGNSTFDHTEKVPAVLKQSSELATDFAETMLGLVSQQKYGRQPPRDAQQPFPAFTARDAEPGWWQPQGTAFCACGLHECTCSTDSASVLRPSDTHTIPRRSGYVETAPPSEVSEDLWTSGAHWAQHDGGAGWDHQHRPVPRGSIIPGPSMSVYDAESQPMRPRNWSSAHLRQGSDWDGLAPSETGTEWVFAATGESTPAAARYGRDTPSIAIGPHVQFRTPSQELVRMSPDPHSLEARLREVEKKLSEAQVSAIATGATAETNQVSRQGPDSTPHAVVKASGQRPSRKPLATSNVPPAPLLHPGLPPVGMPNYVPGYGYNRYVQVGNGVVHPAGPGPYGLAGRTMVATRDSNVWDCTMVFRTGDIIECVVPVEEGRSTGRHNPWNFTGQRLQGICRTQAGSFPASFVREANAPAGVCGIPVGGSAIPTAAPAGHSATAPPPPFSRSTSARSTIPPHPEAKSVSTPGTVPTSTKEKIARNVDSSWLNATTPSRPAFQTGPPRARTSSTPTTAFRNNEHSPSCPSMSDWSRPCTCYDRDTSGSGGSSHAWKPSSAWVNDGWDAA